MRKVFKVFFIFKNSSRIQDTLCAHTAEEMELNRMKISQSAISAMAKEQ